MKKISLGILLILVMFGHNYVLNQTQTMQKQLEQVHHISITQFNLLYSIPSAISILFIIPMGFFYEKLSNKLLWTGAISLSLGQLLVAIFGGDDRPFYYQLLMLGRIIQGVGAEILYMIQGNMASSWMGRFAGVVFILPECGEIANVFITPWSVMHFGMSASFFIGFGTCLISSAAGLIIYFRLTRQLAKPKEPDGFKVLELVGNSSPHTMEKPAAEEAITRITTNNSPQMKLPNSQQNEEQLAKTEPEPDSLFQTGRVTWLVLVLCGVNECLYFPFLDNANELVTNRFCIPYEETGFYLAIPFVAAMITSAVSVFFLPRIARHKLIMGVSVIPLIGHSLIFFDGNCDTEPTILAKILLILGMSFFGMGIGTYYSVSFPAVGLSVPRKIRGMAYACMAFFQTISMTLIPIFAGLIISSEQNITKLSDGYKQQSILFVIICVIGVLISILIYCYGNEFSFKYNDEDQLQIQQKEISTQASNNQLESVE